MPKVAGLVIDVAVGLLVLAAVLYFGHGLLSYIQAPAKLDAAVGNNHALAKGVEAQNKGVENLEAASKARLEKSAKAAQQAGKPEFSAAERIAKSTAPGATPLERAANRINTEFAQ